MGLGNCQRCGNSRFPLPPRPGEVLRAHCVCVPRSFLKEFACVVLGHQVRGRVSNDPMVGERLWAECTRCGRHGAPDMANRTTARRRAGDLLIAWEWKFNHRATETGVFGSVGHRWLCAVADWLTGGRCHD